MILRLCDHPNIIKLYEVYESTKFIYIVMELLKGGELFDRIMSGGIFSEKIIAKIMFKLLGALEYLHSKVIIVSSIFISSEYNAS